MDRKKIEKLLLKFSDGKVSIKDVLDRLENIDFEDMGFAKIDHNRALRQYLPEVVFAENKRPEEVAKILMSLSERNETVFATRVKESHFLAVKKVLPHAKYHSIARIISVKRANNNRDQEEQKEQLEEIAKQVEQETSKRHYILVISAGTSDQAVAEEAAVSAELMGLEVERLYDVGVAGIHRLLAYRDLLINASVCIVIAGMEGALASVVGGIVPSPVIAVPTSIGYGANFGGLSALLGMLNSCAPGIATMNIDNGYGAAVLSYKILKGSI